MKWWFFYLFLISNQDYFSHVSQKDLKTIFNVYSGLYHSCFSVWNEDFSDYLLYLFKIISLMFLSMTLGFLYLFLISIPDYLTDVSQYNSRIFFLFIFNMYSDLFHSCFSILKCGLFVSLFLIYIQHLFLLCFSVGNQDFLYSFLISIQDYFTHISQYEVKIFCLFLLIYFINFFSQTFQYSLHYV